MTGPASEAYEFFVDVWAEEVRRLVPKAEDLRRKYERDWTIYDRGDEPYLTEHDLHEQFRRLWATQHHLVWAAHQLERWTQRLAHITGQPPPPADPLLANLRNALEHLDEADLDGTGTWATAGDNSRRNRSLRNLPGQKLLIGDDGGPRLFTLIDAAELKRRAYEVMTTADHLMQRAEDWVSEYGWPDEPDDLEEP